MFGLIIDFAGSGGEASGASLALLAVVLVVIVAIPGCAYLGGGGGEWYIDERCGDGSIDDDEWGLVALEQAALEQSAESAIARRPVHSRDLGTGGRGQRSFA